MLQTDVIEEIGVDAYLVLCKLADIYLQGKEDRIGKEEFITTAMLNFETEERIAETVFNCRADLTYGAK